MTTTTAPATIVTAADITRGQLVTIGVHTFRVFDLAPVAGTDDIRLWGTADDIDAGFPRDGIRVAATLTLAPAADMPARVVLDTVAAGTPAPVVYRADTAPAAADGTARVWVHLASGAVSLTVAADQLLAVDAITTAALALIDRSGRDAFPTIRVGSLVHVGDAGNTLCDMRLSGARTVRAGHIDTVGCTSCIRELGTLAVRGYSR